MIIRRGKATGLARLAVYVAGCAVVAWARTVRAAGTTAGADHDKLDPYATSLVIVNGFLVFFMQVGFLSYETGSGRAKNVRNILLKNLLDVMLAAIVWWAIGYAFAYGTSAKGVIGTNLFFYEGGSTYDRQTRPWFFSWTFCIAACTIISGCLAERTALSAYPVATLLISGLVHPLLVHWLWSPSGWMSHIGECQVLDFAGGMVVHMLGGLFGLVGAWKCGPRLGRFELVESEEIYEHDGPLAMDSATGMDLGGPAAGSSRAAWDITATAASNTHRLGAPGSGLPGLHQAEATAMAAASVAPGRGPAGDGGAGNSDPLPAIAANWALDDPASSSGSFPGWPGGPRLAAVATAMPGDNLDASAAFCEGKPVMAAATPATIEVAEGSAPLKDNGTVDAVPAPLRDTAVACSGDSSCPQVNGFAVAMRQKFASASMKALQVASAATSRGTCPRAAPRSRRRRAPGRCGVCSQYSPKPMPGHDMAFVTLGTFMLWFGWFGFNNGSVYMYVSGNSPTAAGNAGIATIVSAEVVQRTSMNTALGGASGGLTALFVAAIFSGTYDLRICCNGVLSGLVTVTCMCGFVDPWAAVVCSGIAGSLYTGMSFVLLRCGIDDPLDSSAVHLGNGLIGTIMLAFVAKPEHVAALTGSPCGGVFYSSTGWMQLGLQVMAICVVLVFAGGSAWIMFVILDHYSLLRVDQVTELAGIDNMDHGGPAYDFSANSFNSPGSSAQNVASAGRRMLQ